MVCPFCTTPFNQGYPIRYVVEAKDGNTYMLHADCVDMIVKDFLEETATREEWITKRYAEYLKSKENRT